MRFVVQPTLRREASECGLFVGGGAFVNADPPQRGSPVLLVMWAILGRYEYSFDTGLSSD